MASSKQSEIKTGHTKEHETSEQSNKLDEQLHTVALDFLDPLYVHPSESPSMDLVTEILKGVENYKTWSREFIVALEAKNKLGFINGSCQQPEPDSPRYPHWKRCNALVRAWIHRSLSRDLIHGVVYCESASSIWADLKERFDKVNLARLYYLYKQINTLTQGSNSICEYYSKLRTLWDEYESLIPAPSMVVSKEYTEFCSQLKMMQFFMGLNECYSGIRSQIIMMTPAPTHGQVYAIVSNEETQRKISNHTVVAENSSTAFFTSISDTSSMSCKYCKVPGHIKDNCFKLIGYPPNWGRGRRGRGRAGGRNFGRGPYGRGNNPGGRGFNNNNSFNANMTMAPQEQNSVHNNQEESGNLLSDQQYQQLMQILGANNKVNKPSTSENFINLAALSNSGEVDWKDKGDW